MSSSLENYICSLWHWLEMTPYQYAEYHGKEPPQPYMFSEWRKMLDEEKLRK